MAARHHLGEVLHEHGGIERVAGEAPSQEERAAAAQEAAHHRQVEIVAGGDVRHRESLVKHHVGEQQVVHVAAVTGHIDDLAALLDGFEAREIGDLDAVVEPVPQPPERSGHEGDEGMGIVRGDLLAVGPCEIERLAPREPPGVHLLAHRLAHVVRHVRSARVGDVRRGGNVGVGQEREDIRIRGRRGAPAAGENGEAGGRDGGAGQKLTAGQRGNVERHGGTSFSGGLFQSEQY